MKPSLLPALLLLLASLCPGFCESNKTSRILLLSGEDEYHSARTFASWRERLNQIPGVEATFLQKTGSNDFPGLMKVGEFDLVILMARRLTLPDEQLQPLKNYLASGKPLLGLRTASHAFETWPTFDQDVFGCHYAKHFGKQLKTTLHVVEAARSHPILQKVDLVEFPSSGSLYRSRPLVEGSTLLIEGSVEGESMEPVAWTRMKGKSRIFYSSLGHPDDFKNPQVVQLLDQAVKWCLGNE